MGNYTQLILIQLTRILYCSKINAALEPVSQIAHEGGRFKLCAHPFALGKAVRTANSELDKLTDSYQVCP